MTTKTRTAATTAIPAGLDHDGRLLVEEIERYLAARTRTTAHPLVTKTTEQLVREALASITPAATDQRGPAAADIRLPGGLWRVLPDWALTALRPLHGGRRPSLTTAEHLELTALVLERYGWAQTPEHWRTVGGRRCILGAQAVLYRLGYGSEDTVAAAAIHLHNVLRGRGIRRTYWTWNDDPMVGQDQVLAVVRAAATAARSTR